MARDEGIVPKDSADDIVRKEYKQQIAAFIKQKNFGRQTDLFRQMINAKILRATYSKNQLQEVLVDFWFNHFNVSLTKRECAPFILSYERDAIRPHVTGRFEDMLIATAKSPAMLLYLDNFTSVGANDELSGRQENALRRRLKSNDTMTEAGMAEKVEKAKQRRKSQGLNENYAREVMELHTLGVDGGYTQADVTQAAKVLTGWTLYPMENGYGNALRKIIDKIGEDQLEANGFIHEGDFLFAMNRHDKSEKVVLNKRFPRNGGYQEGVELLTMLARHPSTAKFISQKLATRFVHDVPPASLVEKMSATFLKTNGDLKEVLTTMVSSPEFWQKESLRSKTRSPFDLAISTMRVLQADVQQPYQLYVWMEKMGQKLYAYQAPTGFPDRADFWINTGALLNRMNFGLAIAAQQTRGIRSDLLALNNNHEPESAQAALVQYCKLLLPQRDHEPTIKRLTPLLTQPALQQKLDAVADRANMRPETKTKSESDMLSNDSEPDGERLEKVAKKNLSTEALLAQVVGIIIGSPEFQRK